ncbi:hypothetical protein [Nodosilinea nodulosa]|uniref:hypothetical protein n=1 Tax=Nodosilinea nodulosa TaxID=416001 RepID=UPI0002F5E3A0|nr:hypothetical protein [Nodosilinea nodulosa]
MPPNPFLGLWQRRSIQFDRSAADTSQAVLWIQAETHFADVRQVPFGGPLTPDRYREMDWRSRFDADLLGFAGTFSWAADDATCGTCTWRHALALTPRLWPDTSRYEWLDADTFLERGTCADDDGTDHPFVEHWCRIHPGPVAVWSIAQGDLRGQALTAGDWAVVVHQWRPASASPIRDRETLAAFSATAWRHKRGTWQPQFGTETCLGSPPRWTPQDFDRGAIAAPGIAPACPPLGAEVN